ncbi:hypothetical protein [Paraburkholderia hayleyella]|uniref:hypothetical protein n=1 Tax=Paraburkholderia hayleyella TaxID=2152889 RepID=UPI001FE2A9EA|nr:hypothetical protein [Paraburkholderia hayleyella]
MNHELALDGDILLCACPRPPHMVAGMIATAWFDDMGAGQGEQGDHNTVREAGLPLLFDERAQGVGPGASEGYPYFIETTDGRTFSGKLDAHGRLPRVFTVDADSYHVYWGDEALAKQDGA